MCWRLLHKMVEEILIRQTLRTLDLFWETCVMLSPRACSSARSQIHSFWLSIGDQELVWKHRILSWPWCFARLPSVSPYWDDSGGQIDEETTFIFSLAMLMPAASPGVSSVLRVWLESNLGWHWENIMIFFFSMIQLTGLLISKLVNWT